MRGILSVDDFIKIAISLLAAMFVFIIAYIFITNLISTEEWKAVVKPFDQTLVGTAGLNAPLGSQDKFSIVLTLNDALQEMFFVHGSIACSSACEKGLNPHWWPRPDERLPSSIVSKCKEECGTKCIGKDCIILMPLPAFSSNFNIVLNKPKVYGGGNYKFQFAQTLKEKTINPSDRVSCLLFTKVNEDTYAVEPIANPGECK